MTTVESFSEPVSLLVQIRALAGRGSFITDRNKRMKWSDTRGYNNACAHSTRSQNEARNQTVYSRTNVAKFGIRVFLATSIKLTPAPPSARSNATQLRHTARSDVSVIWATKLYPTDASQSSEYLVDQLQSAPKLSDGVSPVTTLRSELQRHGRVRFEGGDTPAAKASRRQASRASKSVHRRDRCNRGS
jgi:hypothetical protein